MSLEAAKSFLQKADENDELRDKLEALGGDSDAAVKLGAAQGFQFTADEFVDAMDELYGDLSDDELENAAGGTGGIRPKIEF
jgi:predicted ribosomally synthesized peptide with nif11-like leader